MSITLPVDDTGWSMTGGLDTLGSTNAWVSRSCTSWRAWYRLVPGAKSSTIWDSPGMESEVTSVTPMTPSSRFFSSGTVTRDSTSGADSPGASVWIRTVTGDVSGRTSECIPGSITTASTMPTAVTAISRKRSRTLAPITDRSIGAPVTYEAQEEAGRLVAVHHSIRSGPPRMHIPFSAQCVRAVAHGARPDGPEYLTSGNAGAGRPAGALSRSWPGPPGRRYPA
jgi:hypothetical protein